MPGAERRRFVPAMPQAGSGDQQRIPAAFVAMLAFYILFTGTLPAIFQALAFGVKGETGYEFAAAMVTGLTTDLLMLLPLFVLARHPLGILHPLIIAVLLWPTVTHIPNVTEDWGGWSGVFGASPVAPPDYQGLPGLGASAVWLGIAKFNAIRSLALASTYVGFWLLRRKTPLSRLPVSRPNPTSIRTVMLAFIGVSMFVLIVFVRLRGGVDEHLTSLGSGRFEELSSFGPVLLIIGFGATALYLWIAGIPEDIKSPFFLAALAAVSAAAFIGKGSRGGALEVPVMVGLIWALRTRKIPWKTALMIMPFMFVAIGFLGAIRTSSWSGSTAAQTVAQSSWTQSLDRTEKEVAARNAASAGVPVVVRGFDVAGGPLLGRSYAAVVTSFIPRSLWPTKPRGAGQLYARLFYGASLSGTSVPVTPEGEMYWNFGIPGVVILSVLYGAILAGIYRFFWRRYPDPFATVFYLLIITEFQFASDRLVGLEQDIALLLGVWFVMAMLVPKPHYAPELAGRRVVTRPNRILPNQS